jgi:hypothetical protein
MSRSNLPYTTSSFIANGKEFARVHYYPNDKEITSTIWKLIRDRFYIYKKAGQTQTGFFLTYVPQNDSEHEHIICRSGDLVSSAKSALITTKNFNNRKDPRVTFNKLIWESDINDEVFPRCSFDPGNLVKRGNEWWFVPKRAKGGGGVFGPATEEKVNIIKSKPFAFWRNLIDRNVEKQITETIAEGIGNMSLHHSNKPVS